MLNEGDLLPLSRAPREIGDAVSSATIRRAILASELPAIRVGLGPPKTRRFLIKRGDLLAWFERQSSAAA